MISFFKPLTCAFLGFGGATGLVYGGHRVFAPPQPEYSLGSKYCLKDRSHVCVIFGNFGDEYRTPGIWIDPGTSQAVQEIAEESHLGYHEIKDVVPKLFAEHPRLEAFLRSKMKEYQSKGCTYTNKQGQKTDGSGLTLWREMNCTKN
ncbi:hypothetical protein MHLP_00420 [Candidatus Mycoplasma haematolamae str. Purdue]|uniref:Uncharacterized protein n=1 Tax=Mycoplasma haematolamae (strain Purdue) TaxID=1212765 RepID=I7CIH6_MYCHA|nr:hypothetical protein [Candidatus Mycoplasma haematolamae]AFO51664.1 hypothetical protein MHLP_00420 [Candidatus Mycoplasma haematolamae str. Purdue]